MGDSRDQKEGDGGVMAMAMEVRNEWMDDESIKKAEETGYEEE